MRQSFSRGFLVWMGVTTLAISGIYFYSQQSQVSHSLPAVSTKQSLQAGQIAQMSAGVKEQVLGVADSIENMIFRVAIPARFEDSVSFSKPISAPNLIESLQAGDGIRITNGTIPVITNEGILELQAGAGISIDGNKITSTITQGLTSLSAGTNISIDGNKITNTYTAPTIDYTLSGWTDNGTTITLSTTTDSVTVGSLTTGAITAGSLTTSGLALAGGLTVTSGNSLLPDTDLGSDIGSASYRFNNLWVANINSNSSQAFSGQSTFSYAPTSTTITQASLIINPTTSFADGQLLGLGIGGYQRALIDEDGDITLGYNSLTSAPASDYPLNIYGHSGTRTASIDTSGNLNIGTSLTSSGALTITPSAGSNLNIGLSTTGDFAINTDQFYVDTSTGYVGIGISSPSSKLDVVGDVEVGNYLTLGGATNTAGTLCFFNCVIRISRTGGSGLEFATNGGAVPTMAMLGSGEVGIGMTTPTALLDVKGTDDAATTSFQVLSNSGSILLRAKNDRTVEINNNNSTNGLTYIGTTTGSIYFNAGYNNSFYKNQITFYGATEKSSIQGFNADPGIGIGYAQTGTNPNTATTLSVKGSGSTNTTKALVVENSSSAKILSILDSGTIAIGGSAPVANLGIYSGLGDSVPELSINEGGIYNINFGYDSQSLGSNKLNIYKNSSLTHIEDSHSGIILGNTSSRAYMHLAGTYVGIGGSFADSSPAIYVNNTNYNVGIGPTAPVAKFHVVGAATGKALAIFDETGDQALLTASASGVTKFIVGNNGNVGIGTATSDYPLVVNGTVAPLSNVTGSLGTASRYWASSYLYGVNFGGGSATGIQGVVGIADYNLSVYAGIGRILNLGSNGIANQMVISSGNVGIGTATPTTKLHVSGAVTGKALVIFDETGDQALLTASASGVTKFIVDHSGNVGIGTITPGAMLGMQTSSASTVGLTIKASASQTANNFEVRNSSNALLFGVGGLYGGLSVVGTASGTSTAISVGSNQSAVSYWQGDGSIILGNSSVNTVGMLDVYPKSASGIGIIVKGLTSQSGNLQQWRDSAGTPLSVVTSDGSIGIGTSTFGTSAAKVLAIAGSTAPTTAITDGIQLYAVDAAGSHELKVMDEAGNATTLSPHNFSLIESGPSEEMAWSYYSERDGLGVNVDMTKALRIVENLSGEKLIFMKDLESGVSHDPTISTSSAVVSTKDFDLLKNIVETITQAIADIQSKILAFADKFRTKELCLGEEGSETCVTKNQLDELIKMIPSPSPSILPSISPSPTLLPSQESTESATASASI